MPMSMTDSMVAGSKVVTMLSSPSIRTGAIPRAVTASTSGSSATADAGDQARQVLERA
jgi:hypothetical protein